MDPAPDAKTTNFIRILLPTLLFFATGISYAAETRNDILFEKMIALANRAKNHAQWHQDQQALDNYKTKFFRADIPAEDRCEKLNTLPSENLLLFYDDLLNNNRSRELYCRAKLIEKMNLYLEEKASILATTASSMAAAYLEKCSENVGETLGPAENFPLRAEGTSAFWGKQYSKCAITLTFDDGPHPQLTPKLLSALREENLLVNFFVVGRRVRHSPALLQEMDQAGHIIGNHTQTHKDLSKESFKSAVEEIENGFDSIVNALGKYIPFFRFPYGAATKDLRVYLNHLNRVEFFWNIDSRDWAIRDPEELFPFLLQEINKSKKGVLLMHDVQPQTIIVLPHLLRALRESGYKPLLVVPDENPHYVP
jgi:peptidoglycan/xylan/chitin deacetylase (PgdA/CDA1 family)